MLRFWSQIFSIFPKLSALYSTILFHFLDWIKLRVLYSECNYSQGGSLINSVLSRLEILAPSAFLNRETMIICPERKNFNNLVSSSEILQCLLCLPHRARCNFSTDNANLIRVIFTSWSHLLNIIHATTVKRRLTVPGNSLLGNQAFGVVLDTFNGHKQTFLVL